MTKILVPIDGSDSSLRALDAALAWEKDHHNLSLHLITVQQQIVSGNASRYITQEALAEYYRLEGEKALQKARTHLGGLSYEETIEVGPVAETIVAYANKHKIDHIMMGTRGMGSVKGLLLGSVTTKVLTLAEVPVTLFK
jgi:nucleotide-binding universal stress UspA family protein